MRTICVLKNPIQEYAWGSRTAISELLGQPASDRPQAELWMGTHHRAPSSVKQNGKWISLSRLIEENPAETLGQSVAAKFHNRLPYLFKVLAAAKPLSIQAHPDLKQARAGFERENRTGPSIDAPNRNYKDDNHKPECICALTPFWALYGFRRISDILSLMTMICPKTLERELGDLEQHPDSSGLKRFFHVLMSLNWENQKRAIEEAVVNAKKGSKEKDIFRWIIRLWGEYPGDIGIFSPALLNLICLKPRQALFLPPGILHAYLLGVGIELMANSDNVLRGGLTPKYIDAPELLRVLHFEGGDVTPLKPETVSECEQKYIAPAEEFVLSVISIKKGLAFSSPVDRSIEILFCTEGSATIREAEKGESVDMIKGTSVVVPAAVKRYVIAGSAVLYKAAVPL